MPTIIDRTFAPVFGKPSWNVRRGYGSWLTFEFGEPHVTIGEVREMPSARRPPARRRMTSVHGEWHLWIYCCDWVIHQDGEEICHSEADDTTTHKACVALNGQALTGVAVALTGAGTTFTFDLGGVLETTPWKDPEELTENWLLYCPDQLVLTLRSDGRYAYQRGDVTESDENYRELRDS